MYRELNSDHENYLSVCSRCRIPVRSLKGMEELTAYLGEESSDIWLTDLYLGLQHVYAGESFKALVQEPGISMGLLRKCSLDFRRNYTVLEEQFRYKEQIAELYFNDSENDLFDFYTSLYFKLGSTGDEAELLLGSINSIAEKFRNDSAICTPRIASRIQHFLDRAAFESVFESRGNKCVILE